MSMGEFTRLVMATIADDEIINLNVREIGPLFNLSMMTQVDEIFCEKHL